VAKLQQIISVFVTQQCIPIPSIFSTGSAGEQCRTQEIDNEPENESRDGIGGRSRAINNSAWRGSGKKRAR
jgi:hypothetical protein